MRFRDAAKLHLGDEVIDKDTGESIRVICAWDEPVIVDDKNTGKLVMIIEGTGEKQGYNHWSHTRIK